MAILKVARLGHPVLLRRADPVHPEAVAHPGLQQLIDDMLETMRDEHGVGLAAPQIHRSIRLFVMDPGGGLGPDDEGAGPRVLVNPELSFPDEDRIALWEGCLSIPGIRGETERHARVDATYLDRKGRRVQTTFRGLPAAIVQHETDHLDGILFLRRMPDLSRLAFEDQLSRFRASERAGGGDDDGDDGDDTTGDDADAREGQVI